MNEENKKNAIAFLKFCAKLAVYPTDKGKWILQSTEDEHGYRMCLSEDELYEAFVNNKLEELLKNAIIKTKILSL